MSEVHGATETLQDVPYGSHRYEVQARRVNSLGELELGIMSPSASISFQPYWMNAPVLSVVQTDDLALRLDWKVTRPAAAYEIEWISEKEWVRLADTGKTWYEIPADFGLKDDTTYTFRVTPVQGGERGKTSKTAAIKLQEAWKFPPQVTAVQSDEDAVTLTWRAIGNAEAFKIYVPERKPATIEVAAKDCRVEKGLFNWVIDGLARKTYTFTVTPVKYNSKGAKVLGSKSTTLKVKVGKFKLPFTFVSVPACVYAYEGGSCSVSPVVWGKKPFVWTWERLEGDNWAALPEETGSSLTIIPTLEDDGAWFRCRVMDDYGETYVSEPIQLVMMEKTGIVTQPQDVTDFVGRTVSILVDVVCDTVSRQWQKALPDSQDWQDL